MPGGQLLTFADPGVETTSLQNAIARTILEYGYGYRTLTVSGPRPSRSGTCGARRTYIWKCGFPAFKGVWEETSGGGNLLTLGNSLQAVVSQSAFLIPQYTADANPGLFRVQGLERLEFQRLFGGADSNGKARLITCVTEWECARINEKQVHGYGLDEFVQLVDPRTPEALYNQIRSAFENKEDILFYYWWPSALATTLEEEFGGFAQLREPGWSQGCWDRLTSTVAATDITQGCEYPDASSLIAVRKDLEEFSPTWSSS